MEDGTKISSFENLLVWQEAQKWAVQIYKITRSYPKDELYGITSQLRRAVASISANIAEGFGRQSIKDKLHFYVIAYGSCLEVNNFLHLSNKLEFINSDELASLLKQGTSVQKLLNAFMRPLKNG